MEARPEARACVDEITRLLVEKLLLTPTEQLKALGDTDTLAAHAEALTRLFGLSPSPDGESEAVGAPADAEDPSATREAPRRVELFRPKTKPSPGSGR
jgi:hypothetical protein